MGGGWGFWMVLDYWLCVDWGLGGIGWHDLMCAWDHGG